MNLTTRMVPFSGAISGSGNDKMEAAEPVRSPKNIVVLSDGTGQRGGVFFDEARTNIYKLYRATRSGPDSQIDPKKQVAFYDPGLGTQLAGGTTVTRTYRAVYNFLSQATGLGITKNIIECYAAIIRLWEPGDRIYLFGFSRGAYTVRCLASVLCLCGIPRKEKGTKSLRRDVATSLRIATYAVTRVYQHVSSPRDAQFKPQRDALAKRFREDYGSADGESPNDYPFFVGVFDTVAALFNKASLAVVIGVYLLALGAASIALGQVSQSTTYWAFWLSVSTLTVLFLMYLYTHLKFAFGLPGFSWWETVHLTTFRQKFYDTNLNPNIDYSRHAISIDERRSDFKRVAWGNRGADFKERKKMDRFQQLWFAGNHADIGGGYPEDEARLSDIALDWMISSANSDALGDEKLHIDSSVLQLQPALEGMQHDETRSLAFKFAGNSDRDPVKDATVHSTVQQRFALKGVLQYDVTAPYRPEALRNHTLFSKYYHDVPLPRTTAWQDIKETWRRWRHVRWRAAEERLKQKALKMKGEPMQLDKALSWLGLFFLCAGLAVATAIIGYQALHWLMTANWPSFPLELVAGCIRSVGRNWEGLQFLYAWLLSLPLSISSAIAGSLMFWALGVASAKVYKKRVEMLGAKPTPSQTHA